MTKINLLTVGSDPEVFLKDDKLNKFVPAIGLIPGDKHDPFPVSKKGHAIQVDNVMAEVCIPPSNNPKRIFKDIHFSLKEVQKRLPKSLRVEIIPSADFEEADLQDPMAQEFGCDPDINAWTLNENPAPDGNVTFRSAGGHLHCGFTNPTEENCVALVKILDLYLGVPSIILDTDERRRQLYGKAGAFRYKGYGFEYRVLSNFWIKNEKLVKWVYNNILEAFEFYNTEKFITEVDRELIIEAINTSNAVLAKRICDKYNINYKP